MSSNVLRFTAENSGDWSVGIPSFSIPITVTIEDSDQEYYEEIRDDLDKALVDALNIVMKDFYEASVRSELQRLADEKDWMDNDD